MGKQDRGKSEEGGARKRGGRGKREEEQGEGEGKRGGEKRQKREERPSGEGVEERAFRAGGRRHSGSILPPLLSGVPSGSLFAPFPNPYPSRPRLALSLFRFVHSRCRRHHHRRRLCFAFFSLPL